MNFFDRIANVDRRIIYVLIGLAVVLPMVLRVTMPVQISDAVNRAYQAVDRLPRGSVVMISIDYDASSAPEVQPMLQAVLEHCFRKGIKVIMTGHWVLGLPLGQLALTAAAREHHKTYGVDYVDLGYRPGYVALMLGIGREIRDFFAGDFRGTPIDSLPMMRPIHNYEQVDLLVALEAGNVGDAWVQSAGARYGVPIIMGSTGVVAPDVYPYLQSHQIQGLIGGLRGAAEYETLIKRAGTGLLGMPAQSYGHALIIFFIIVGNVGYFLTRKRRKS